MQALAWPVCYRSVGIAERSPVEPGCFSKAAQRDPSVGVVLPQGSEAQS